MHSVFYVEGCLLTFRPFSRLLFICEGRSCLFARLFFHLERRQNIECNLEKTNVLLHMLGNITMPTKIPLNKSSAILLKTKCWCKGPPPTALRHAL